MAYPIQRHFLESLEAVFLTQARSLLKEIARDLGQPEKPLLKAFEQSKVNLHIIDTQEESYNGCKALVAQDTLAKRCREPVYQGTSYCPCHLRLHPPEEPQNLPSVRRLKTEEGEEYFVDSEQEAVYTTTFELCGKITNGKLTVFKVENEIEE